MLIELGVLMVFGLIVLGYYFHKVGFVLNLS